MKRIGVTASGFAWQLDDAVLNNMELVDALAEMQEENPLQISAVCRLVLGKAQRKALYDPPAHRGRPRARRSGVRRPERDLPRPGA